MFTGLFRGLSNWDLSGVCLKRSRDQRSTAKQAESSQVCSRRSTSKGKQEDEKPKKGKREKKYTCKKQEACKNQKRESKKTKTQEITKVEKQKNKQKKQQNRKKNRKAKNKAVDSNRTRTKKQHLPKRITKNVLPITFPFWCYGTPALKTPGRENGLKFRSDV